MNKILNESGDTIQHETHKFANMKSAEDTDSEELMQKVSKTKSKANKTKQNKTKQNKTKQNKTKQNKTKQNKTKQNKTKQNKTKPPPNETKKDAEFNTSVTNKRRAKTKSKRKELCRTKIYARKGPRQIFKQKK